jgi:hypothetical protein
VPYTYTAHCLGKPLLKPFAFTVPPEKKRGGTRHDGLGAKPPVNITVSKKLTQKLHGIPDYVRNRTVLLKVFIDFALVRLRTERK